MPSSILWGRCWVTLSRRLVVWVRNCSKVSAGFSSSMFYNLDRLSLWYYQKALSKSVRMFLMVSSSLFQVTFRMFLSRERIGSMLSMMTMGSKLSFSLIYQCSLTRSSHSSKILTYFCISLCFDHLSKHFKEPRPSRSRNESSSRTYSMLGCKVSQCSANRQTHKQGD